jgi:hypothetical protein
MVYQEMRFVVLTHLENFGRRFLTSHIPFAQFQIDHYLHLEFSSQVGRTTWTEKLDVGLTRRPVSQDSQASAADVGIL